MTTKQFLTCTVFLLIGIAIGAKISSVAYKPILVAQAIENRQCIEGKKEWVQRYKILEVEIEAHRQDMAQFISKSTLMEVLEQLGISRGNVE